VTQFTVAATNRNAVGCAVNVKTGSESCDVLCGMAHTDCHPISLLYLVTAMANSLASQPLNSDEIKSNRVKLGEVRFVISSPILVTEHWARS